MRWFRRRRARYDIDVPPSMPSPGAPPRAHSRPGPFEALAHYNSERARGIVHTPEYDIRMAALQVEFDECVRDLRLPPR